MLRELSLKKVGSWPPPPPISGSATALLCANNSREMTMLVNEMKWNEWSFMPPLCTYRLNWVRRTSWGWWDEWDDTALKTQDSKFEPRKSEAERATIWNHYEWAEKKHFVSLKLKARVRFEPAISDFSSCTRAPAHDVSKQARKQSLVG